MLPQLGESLIVVMLAIDPDTGTAKLGLRDTTVAWEVTVDAQHVIEAGR